MGIIGFDLAFASSGYCKLSLEGDILSLGSVKKKKGMTEVEVVGQFYDFCSPFIKEDDLVFFESQIAVHPRSSSQVAKIHGVLYVYLWRLSSLYASIHPSQLRSFACLPKKIKMFQTPLFSAYSSDEADAYGIALMGLYMSNKTVVFPTLNYKAVEKVEKCHLQKS